MSTHSLNSPRPPRRRQVNSFVVSARNRKENVYERIWHLTNCSEVVHTMDHRARVVPRWPDRLITGPSLSNDQGSSLWEDRLDHRPRPRKPKSSSSTMEQSRRSLILNWPLCKKGDTFRLMCSRDFLYFFSFFVVYLPFTRHRYIAYFSWASSVSANCIVVLLSFFPIF